MCVCVCVCVCVCTKPEATEKKGGKALGVVKVSNDLGRNPQATGPSTGLLRVECEK